MAYHLIIVLAIEGMKKNWFYYTVLRVTTTSYVDDLFTWQLEKRQSDNEGGERSDIANLHLLGLKKKKTTHNHDE